jgi:hypothetical protein
MKAQFFSLRSNPLFILRVVQLPVTNNYSRINYHARYLRFRNSAFTHRLRYTSHTAPNKELHSETSQDNQGDDELGEEECDRG